MYHDQLHNLPDYRNWILIIIRFVAPSFFPGWHVIPIDQGRVDRYPYTGNILISTVNDQEPLSKQGNLESKKGRP